MNIFLDLARRYVAAGLSVIPIRHGTKEPDNSLLAKTTGNTTNWVPSAAQAPWRVYCDRIATDDELQVWFAEGNAHIGIVGGGVSGGLVRIDFEHRACWPTWVKLLRQTGYLAAVAMQLPTVQTPKGHHVYFRMPDPTGHVLLSSHGMNNELLVLSETQGEGCYCVAPPMGEAAPPNWLPGGCGDAATNGPNTERPPRLLPNARPDGPCPAQFTRHE